MKKVISLVVLLCAFAGSALASAPESALKALELGNEKFVLEQSLKDAPLALVIADESIAQEPAALFGLSADQLASVRAPFGAESGLAVQSADIKAPLILVLGVDEAAVWAVYANTLLASPDLIHAVLKGQVTVSGALLNAETGAVTMLGAHPEQQVMVGHYLLGTTAPEAPAAENAAQAEAAPAAEPEAAKHAEPAEGHDAEPAAAKAEAAEDHAAETHAEPAAEGHAAAPAAVEEGSGGSGFMLVILFVVALVGAVVFLDKVVLKD